MSAQILNNPLNSFRQSHGLSQFALSLLLNVSVGMVATVESGVPKVLPDRLTAALKQYLTPEEQLEFIDTYASWRTAARHALKTRIRQKV